MMWKRWYVSVSVHDSFVFSYRENPTARVFDRGGSYVIGPFRTKRGALYMLKNLNNPLCQTVSQAEKQAEKQAKAIADS